MSEAWSRRRRSERARSGDAGQNLSTTKPSEEHRARPKDVAVAPKAKGPQERGRGRAGRREEEEEKRRRRGRAAPEEVQEKRKDGAEEGERRGGEGGGMKAEARGGSGAAEGEKGERSRRHSEEERERRGGGEQEEQETGRTVGGAEGGENALRWRVHQLEKDKLELISLHNQETSSLQSQLAKMRCEVERGEAVRQTLEYQLTVEKRHTAKVSDLTEHTDTLTVRCAELQQTVSDLQTALQLTRQSRQQDQHALQQEVEERDRLLLSVNTESDRLRTLLQEQEEVMEGLKRRLEEVEKERERDSEAFRRQSNELKYLMEREDKSRKALELSDQKVKSLQSNVEAERSAHLETKFNSEIIQLRIRDLEAAVSVERCGHQEALSSLEMLRSQFVELERAASLDRDAHHKLQKEYEQCRRELSVALETERRRSSELMLRLEEEERQHTHCLSLLQQAEKTQSCIEETHTNCLKQIQHTLQQHIIATTHNNTEAADRQDMHTDAVLLLLKNTLSYYQHTLDNTNTQLQELLCASERLEQDNQTHRHINSEQLKRNEESDLLLASLREEVTRLRQESSDASAHTHRLRVEVESTQLTLETERRSTEEERRREREERGREREEKERERLEREREREETEREREECKAELQRVTEVFQKESKERVSFLYSLYQRLVAGCVLLDASQCMLGNFSWPELCDVIVEQVDSLTSDLRRANDAVVQLQSVCDSKSVCVRELQRSQQGVLSRLEESVRQREQAWDAHRKEADQQHAHALTQLHNKAQLYHSQVESLGLRASSLERERAAAASDLARLRGLLARSRGARAALLSACALLAGALVHTYRRARALSAQRALFYRLLVEREGVETEVRRLVDALGGEEEAGAGGEQRTGRGLRRWRKAVCAVLAANRLLALARSTCVALRVERRGGGGGGGGEDGGMRRGEDEGGRRRGQEEEEEEEDGWRPAVCVCVCGQTPAKRTLTWSHSLTTTDKEDDDADDVDKEEGGAAGFVRWLRSKHFSSVVLSSMTQLQEAQMHTDSTPPEVMSAAREGLSHLLEHLLGQSDVVSGPAPYRGKQCPLVVRLGRGLARLTAPPVNRKTLVSSLQQHFLLFSQRLHSAEVERRSLRLELANLKRASKGNRGNHRHGHKDPCDLVPVERFESVCAELRQALNREQEAQGLLREQSAQLRTLTAHTADTTRTQHTLSQAAQEVRRKEQSLRILGKRLSAAQREKRELEDRLRQMEDSLTNTHRSKTSLVNFMTTVENTYKEVRDGLVQSRCSVTGKPLPLQLPRVHAELSGTERMMGGVEVTACERLVSTFSDLYQAAGSRIGWLEQEISAQRGHVTALRGELQDACLRDNLAYIPVAEFSPLADPKASHRSPLSDLSKELPISRSSAQPCPSPGASS